MSLTKAPDLNNFLQNKRADVSFSFSNLNGELCFNKLSFEDKSWLNLNKFYKVSDFPCIVKNSKFKIHSSSINNSKIINLNLKSDEVKSVCNVVFEPKNDSSDLQENQFVEEYSTITHSPESDCENVEAIASKLFEKLDGHGCELVDRLLGVIDLLKSKVSSSPKLPQQKLSSYAKVVAGSNPVNAKLRAESKPCPKQIVVFRPADKQTTSELKNEILQKISASKIGTGFGELKSQGQKALITSIRDCNVDPNEVVNKLKTVLPTAKIVAPKRRSPRVIVFNIPASMTFEDFCSDIYASNDIIRQHFDSPELFFKNVKHVRTTKMSNKGLVHYIFETTAKLREVIKSLEKFNLTFGARSWDFSVFTQRCFNCHRHGHNASNCKAPTMCSKCSCEHKSSDCKSETAHCAFCHKLGVKSDHWIGSITCQHELKRKKAILDYTDFTSDFNV